MHLYQILFGGIKHKLCPSLLKNCNKLTEEDIKNHKLRLIQKAIKNHTIDNILPQINQDNDDD